VTSGTGLILMPECQCLALAQMTDGENAVAELPFFVSAFWHFLSFNTI
jgi:hypothetical protein